MLDDDDYTIKVKCQAEANDSESYETPSGSNSKSTKSDDGSTLIHQEESLDFVLSSNITKVYNQEEEEVMAGEEKVEGAGGDGKGEVEFLEEVKAGEGGGRGGGTVGRQTTRAATAVEPPGGPARTVAA